MHCTQRKEHLIINSSLSSGDLFYIVYDEMIECIVSTAIKFNQTRLSVIWR